MCSSIRKFWQRLQACVHPDDEHVFKSHPDHTFNLDFPPPAFTGDVDNAPIVVLMANGGYDPDPITGTRSEFLKPEDRKEHLAMLSRHGVHIPQSLSPYYTRNFIFPWVRDGKAVIVNAVAYRSPNISQERENRKLTKLLPSWEAHQRWLHEEVLPAARRNERRVIAHRWPLWGLQQGQSADVIRYSSAPRSPHLGISLRKELASWLSQQTAMR